MDAFTLGLAGTLGASLGFSLYAAQKAFQNISPHGTMFNFENYREKERKRKGVFKQTNVLSVFPEGTIRTRDGGYICGYSFASSETFYGTAEEVRRLYDRLALVLTCGFPENSVIQLRIFNGAEPGDLLNTQLLEMAAQAGECSPVAQMLQNEEIEYYQALAGNGNFRTRKFYVWLYLPAKKKGIIKNGFSGWAENLTNLNLTGLKDNWQSNEKAVVCRYVADERECLTEAERHFRSFEQNFPVLPGFVRRV